ncbi:putative 40S ribosomal protein S7 [Paratrimastix pyriformis]|uniref:40S ribosomal protein S7 n=1 Tax=Paratrimastix pyriformis TaxID=342808 RepID=A0ABQ8UJ93_9EUKA|nr:putative 40S ribosomal protein S7 [Paratrimastix pyriformis]
MLSTKGKIVKPKGVVADAFETSVAQALVDLEHGPSDLAADLKNLHITGAKEIPTVGGQKALVMFVPVPLLKLFQKISTQLIPELEKKFGHHVVIIGQRRCLALPVRGRKLKQPRPRSRTLTAIHEAILDDIAHPVEIVGKRIRIHLDGKKQYKIHLDPKEKANVEHKLDTFRSIYRTLTGKDAVFEFPQ